MDITAAFKGITTPISQLYAEVEQRGWTVQDISIKNDTYQATVKNPHGEKVEKVGRTPETALAACLTHLIRKEFIRQGRWQNLWTHKLPEIAEAYAKAPVFDPKAAPAWRELAQDSMARMAELQRQGLKIKVVDDPEPYKSSKEMADDIHKGNFSVSRANSEHPLWTEDQNVAFRTVHDVMGHAVAGGDFGWHGENLACGAHFPLLSPNAQRALFTECIGQTAYGAHYRGFGPQKVTFLDDHFLPVQAQENPAGHMGEPIEHTIPPTAMPQMEPSEPVGEPEGYPHPHALQEMGLPAAMVNYQTGLPRLPGQLAKRKAGVLRDPNAGYETGIEPPYPNAYLSGDPLDMQGTHDVARKLDTGWANFTDATGQPDYTRMKQAIVNAFRAAILSPLKNLKWNAAHYQDLSSIPHDVTDPKVYWDTLESARINHNRSVGVPNPEIAHKKHYKALMQFYHYYQNMHPGMSPGEAKAHADREVQTMQAEEEARLMRDSKDETMDILEPKIYAALDKRLKEFMKGEKRKVAAEDIDANPYTQPERYGGFIGRHLIAIAKVSQYSDQLLEAALEDVKSHDGSGHHFRQMVMSLNIPFVAPKVASFVWLLLQPMTSQLATIDTHMADVLGYKYKDVDSKRDYFRLERELQAGRDAAGYGDVPLGRFQWAMWDYKRTGEGTHQDHSPLKPWNPQDWRTVGFHPVAAPGQHKGEDWPAPDWWVATQPYRDAEVAHWNTDVAPNYPKSAVPWQEEPVTRPTASVPTGFGYMYHVSPATNHESIMEKGLQGQNRVQDGMPSMFNYDKPQPPGNYLFHNLNDAVNFEAAGHGWPSHQGAYNIYRVDTRGLPIYPDPENQLYYGPASIGEADGFDDEDYAPLRYVSPVSIHPKRLSLVPEDQGEENYAQEIPEAWLRVPPTELPLPGHEASSDGTDDELHVALDLPENIRLRLYEWAQTLPLTDDEYEPIEEYHVTVAYAEHGVDDVDLSHLLRTHNLTGMKFSVDKLDKFGEAVVLRLKSDDRQFQKAAEDVNKYLEELGVEVTRYPGGWKPHITIAYTPSEVKGHKPPPISFRTPGMSFSVPRKRDNSVPLWHTANDDVKIVQHDNSEGAMGTGGPLANGWGGRVPIVYDAENHHLHVGMPDTTHMRTEWAAKDAGYELGGDRYHGWVGFNPEAKIRGNHTQEPNIENFGWYSAPPNAQELAPQIAKHFGFDPNKPPEDMRTWQAEDDDDDWTDDHTASAADGEGYSWPMSEPHAQLHFPEGFQMNEQRPSRVPFIYTVHHDDPNDVHVYFGTPGSEHYSISAPSPHPYREEPPFHPGLYDALNGFAQHKEWIGGYGSVKPRSYNTGNPADKQNSLEFYEVPEPQVMGTVAQAITAHQPFQLPPSNWKNQEKIKPSPEEEEDHWDDGWM